MCGAGIAAIKYNLDGDLVAGASTNGSIYLYRVSRCGCDFEWYQGRKGRDSVNDLLRL